MHRSHRIGIVLTALSLGLGGCFGPFNLTRRLYDWNTKVGDKWEREIVFLLLAVTPVYGVATLADAVVFNSMEFWTGNNPVDAPRARGEGQPTSRRLARGDAEVLLTRLDTPESRAMSIAFYRKGQLEQTLRIERRPGEPAIARDAQGRVVMSAQTLPDGGIVITDGDGQPVAAYPHGQVASLTPSLQ